MPAAQAAEQIGFELRNWPVSAFDPAQWSAGIDVAIAEGYDLIDMQGGLPPELIRVKVEEASAADILVTTGHPVDPRTSMEMVFIEGRRVYDAQRDGRRW